MTTLEKAIEVYGKDMQLNVAIEEFSELIKEICKHKRGEDNLDNIIEEMADCYIMLEQMELIFDIDFSQINDKIVEKKNRLEKRLAEPKDSEMKPCCKCGCEAELISSQTFAWCNIYWYVICTNENCEEKTMLKYDTKRDAISAWNRRANNEL